MVNKAGDGKGKSWKFLTTHGIIFIDILNHPGDTVREISDRLGYSESAVSKVINDLRRSHYLSAKKIGRQNLYEANLELSLRHKSVSNKKVRHLVALLFEGDEIS